MKTSFLLGRVIFGGFFLYSGIHHFQEKDALVRYASAKQAPLPEVMVPITGAALIAGGASIVLGVKPKVGALAIAGFLAGVSPLMHDFWNAKEPAQRQSEMVNFMKNVAMMGGALALMGVEEPWPASVPIGQPSKLDRLRRFASKMAA
jgi:uncharacterized membrane protein YphA (DoxX/SURF4 family)